MFKDISKPIPIIPPNISQYYPDSGVAVGRSAAVGQSGKRAGQASRQLANHASGSPGRITDHSKSAPILEIGVRAQGGPMGP